MKKNPARKSKLKPAKAAVLRIEIPEAPAAMTAVKSVPAPVISPGAYGEFIAMPPPEDLLREAEEEPNYRDLSQYAAVIGTLRDKGLSYRDIAEWLSERGVPVDHNAVYRVFTNTLSDRDAHEESERAEREAQDEAERNRLV